MAVTCMAGVFLVTAIPVIPAAAEETYEETYVYQVDEIKSQFPAVQNTQVTFPMDGAVVDVGNELVYHLFRLGDTKEEQEITVGTMDITAAYGDDYEIVIDGAVIDGHANCILDGSGTTYDVYLGKDVLADESGEKDASDQTISSNESEDSEKRTQLREQASSVFNVTFASGQQEKEIRIRAKVPKVAQGDTQLQLAILDCPQATTMGAYQTSAITLRDKREIEEAKVSIQKDSAKVVDGYVTVMIERTGNVSGYTSYELQTDDGTAVNGKDYVLESNQLTFSPGVTKQRVHIPLVSADVDEEKSFTLRTGESKEVITYETTALGTASFKPTRGLIDIPMSDMEKAGSTVGGFKFSPNDSGDCYEFSFDTGFGDGDNRSASIKSKQMYDFTGVNKIRLSASYKVGTIAGDFLDVYASDQDLCNNKNALGQITSKKYGGRLDTISLTGQGIKEVPVDRMGEYSVYLTAQQHPELGHIGYNLYNQDFNGGDKGHLALVMTDYKLEMVDPSALDDQGTSNLPAGDLRLTLASDSSVNGKTIDAAYRDESFQISYNLMQEDARYVGYQILDASSRVIYTKKTDSPTFLLSSDLIHQCASKISNQTFRIRPMFERDQAEVQILKQDFEVLDMNTVTAEIDMEQKRAVYKDSGVEIATVTWNRNTFSKEETLAFDVKENGSYTGDYHFTAYKVCAGENRDSSQMNPLYYTDPEWSTTIHQEYYEITPLISNRKAQLLLNVTGATHGKFPGKQDESKDEVTIDSYDGAYDCNDIVHFVATPNEGYRAKWSYRDILTGTTKVYYGSRFYYRVQFPVLLTDNYVSLEFEKCDTGEKYYVAADVLMQGGDLMHQPENGTEFYSPLESAVVSMEGQSLETMKDGTTGVMEMTARTDEVYTALVLANNRYDIQDVVIGNSKDHSLRQTMKLSYYYEGPRVTGMRYFDREGSVQNGDTIYLKDETDSCIVAATIDTAGKDITDVVFKLKDSDGNMKGSEYIGERNGSEYLWSSSIGLIASEGDQIWVELVHRTYDDDGAVKDQISYGEMNTGYSFVMAEYTDASYIPDTGDEKGCNVPILGNMQFLFGVAGIKPVLTTSKSGNVTYLNIGTSMNGGFNVSNKKFGLKDWNSYKNSCSAVMKGLSPRATKDQKIAGKQQMKKNAIAVSLSVSVQLALYDTVNVDNGTHQLVCVGAYLGTAFNTAYTFNYPMVIEGIPFFVNLTISGNFAETIQVMPVTETGYVEVDSMHDPTKSSYRPDNDFNARFSLGVSAGVGVNGLVSVSGGGTGSLSLDWVDFSYGSGNLSLTIDMRVELLLVGRTFSYKCANYQMFNTNPYLPEEDEQEVQNQIQNMSLASMQMRSLSDYHQSVYPDASEGTPLITDAYQFSRPQLFPLEDDKYLVVATVDGSQVQGLSGKENTAVLSYAIYDKQTKSYEKNNEGKIFQSLEPEEYVGDSINFSPRISKVNDGKVAITWNSVLYGEQKEHLNLSNLKSVMKMAVLDPNTNEKQYRSLVSEDEKNQLLTNLVVDTAYDEDNNELLVLYRCLNTTELSEESKLSDYVNAGTKLMCSNVPMEEATSFSEGVEIDHGEDGRLIKDAQLEIMDGIPICTYHIAEGKQASILSESEGGTLNHIYVTKLVKEAKTYQPVKAKEVTSDSSKYNALPQLVSGEVDGEKVNLLMWEQENRMAAIDPVAFLDGKTNFGNIATIVNDDAGSVEDFHLIKGEDGKIYALWKMSGSTGTQLKMSALVKDGSEEGTVCWGAGTNVMETSDQMYMQSVSSVIDKSGILHVLSRDVGLTDENGYSTIVIRSAPLQEKCSVVPYQQLAEQMEDVENMGITVSNLSPKAGEIVTVSAKIKNEGVQSIAQRTIRLLANGQETGLYQSLPVMGAGEEQNVVFSYEVPDTIASENIVFSVDLNDAGVMTQSVSSASVFDIESLSFEKLNYTDNQTANRYLVQASVRNTGNEPAEKTKMVLSHLELGKDGTGQDNVQDTVLGMCDVPALGVEETANVSFEVEVDPVFFTGGTYQLASVGVALYENYGTETQNMVAAIQDYLESNQIPQTQNMLIANQVKLGVGQKQMLHVAVLPSVVQEKAGLTYAMSNPKIATIDDNGMLTGLKAGKCTVTVTTKDGLKRQSEVVVTKDADQGDDNQDLNPPNTKPGDTSAGGINGESGKQSQKDNVHSGDSTNVWKFIVAFIISLGVVLGIVWYKRSRKK